ncbi:hypothetical protein GCM10012275_39610 [Longimycelium tulufanense]|uniref:Uncharacterized protein n=1 Tax=Longimycelium tulufanense TaxID=907463 RepID=A0A8J3CEY9_9PSEU|nr:hypothetical protein [Longimycelium tulufanense]GGM65134.1 hypothetical protein GCM10012275_39610 [Longimycelium tulufanense]
MTTQYLDMAGVGRALRRPVSRQVVTKWRERYPSDSPHPFPAPDVMVGAVPGWSDERLPEIEAWREKLPGRTGRPRKAQPE